MFHQFEELGTVFCCENDDFFTFKSEFTIISALVGYSRSEIETKFKNRFIGLIAPENHEDVFHSFKNELSQVKITEVVFQIIHKSGRKIWVLANAKLVKTPDGKELIFGTMVDMSKTKKLYDFTLQSLKQYQIILAQTENVIFELDCVRDTMFFSDTWFGIFGHKPFQEDFIKKMPTNPHIHPDDVPGLLSRLQTLKEGGSYQTMEVRIAKSDGSYLWCLVRATAVYDNAGNTTKIVGIIINVDKDTRATKELKLRAEQDALTQLLNNNTSRRQAEEYLEKAEPDAHCALLIIDLDNFKNINDNYGHLFGDQLLTKAANEIKLLFRSQDIIARIGGDEFMVLMKNINDLKLVEKRCSQLIEAFSSILSPEEYKFTVSGSIGVAFAPVKKYTYSELFERADKALYQAKDLGRHQYVLSQESEI